jgi:hypothetical protein
MGIIMHTSSKREVNPRMETKMCRYCHFQKPLETFEVANIIRGKLYRRHRCADCKNKLQTNRLQTARVWLEEYKKARFCERCGYSDYRALTFHHRDRTSKEFAVADMIRRGRSLKAIIAEIAKCSILCANCHFIEHYHAPHFV